MVGSKSKECCLIIRTMSMPRYAKWLLECCSHIGADKNLWLVLLDCQKAAGLFMSDQLRMSTSVPGSKIFKVRVPNNVLKLEIQDSDRAEKSTPMWSWPGSGVV